MTLERRLGLFLVALGLAICCAAPFLGMVAAVIGVGLVASGCYLLAHERRAVTQQPTSVVHNHPPNPKPPPRPI